MAVTEITFIEETTGGVEERTETISSSRFAIKMDGQLYRPAVVSEIEIENDAQESSPSDQCGNTERNRTGNQGWVIRVTGIITANDSRSGNLSLQMLRDVIATTDEVTVRSDIISGTFVVGNTVITEASDLFSITTRDTNGEEQAFDFTLQLGEEETG